MQDFVGKQEIFLNKNNPLPHEAHSVRKCASTKFALTGK